LYVIYFFPFVLDLPLGLLCLAIGLWVTKGFRPLRLTCIVISLLALSMPLGEILGLRRAAAGKREGAEHLARIFAERDRERDREREREIEQGRVPGPQRQLTGQQNDVLVHDLSPLKGHRVRISYPWDTQESLTFAQNFLYVFGQAGWVGLDGEGLELARGSDIPGADANIAILLSSRPSNGPPPEYGAIVDALTHAGIKVTFAKTSSLSPGEVELRILDFWIARPAGSGP
jgi:hypothetical protein